MGRTHLITGAHGFSGRQIARALIERGHEVRTLTNSAGDDSLAQSIDTRPLDFEDLPALERAFEGVDVFYNTYWVRFAAAGFDQEVAVGRSAELFRCASLAGVRRIVHVSITHPDQASPWAYFRGKARIEAALRASGVPHSILRPAVVFGSGDILINNIAWLLRRFPVFGIFGDGRYRLRPIHVDDLAQLAASEGQAQRNRVIDAVGPESFEYRELVAMLAKTLERQPRWVRLSPWLGHVAARALGAWVGDVVLTREEIGALMDGLLDTAGPATGSTLLSTWAHENRAKLGRDYANEVARRR